MTGREGSKGVKQTSGAESLPDTSPFVKILETKARVYLMDVLLRNPSVRFTAKQLYDLAGVDKSTFSRNKDVLLEMNVMKEVGKAGNAAQYQLNTESTFAKRLREAQLALLRMGATVADVESAEGEEDYRGGPSRSGAGLAEAIREDIE